MTATVVSMLLHDMYNLPACSTLNLMHATHINAAALLDCSHESKIRNFACSSLGNKYIPSC